VKKITRMFMHRKKMGWTQLRLAETIGVTQPRISAWENGTMDIPPKRARQIGEALGLDPDALTDEA
jgi:transcriptional regulator with XRE-family HTH domain